jgi:hypothetical protein
MPVTEFLDGHSFDPETRRVMGVALEMARAALGLADRADPITSHQEASPALAQRAQSAPQQPYQSNGYYQGYPLQDWYRDDSY